MVEVTVDPNGTPTPATTNRRTLVKVSTALGAGALGATILGPGIALGANDVAQMRNVNRGDIAIMRFLAALETLESDLWQQYNELGGIQDSEVPGGSGNLAYTNALKFLDGDMDQYIHDNTDDEITHWHFLNAVVASVGGTPVNLDEFRTLPSSTATGAQNIGRLTNLMQLTVDTSFWTRYRSDNKNPDPPFNDTFANAIPGLAAGSFPAIPRNNADVTGPPDHLQAIANTAGFHFAFIEQGGTSLYPSLAQRVTNPIVLRILLSIGPTETMHFQTWQDKAGNFKRLTDPTNGLVFPELNTGDPLLQTNLIMPEPTIFLNKSFPIVSIIRPTNTFNAARGAVNALTADGLFIGQSKKFFNVLHQLADAADAARRGG
jgi:hypothetical protein